jgi:hypothetical protein
METQTEIMTTGQIAERLIALCSQGEFEKAQRELYADDAFSIEPHETPEFHRETRGLKAIIEKGGKFASMVEMLHGVRLSTPLIVGNSIALAMALDMTMKGQKRSVAKELCVYQVRDGKIASEQFFI